MIVLFVNLHPKTEEGQSKFKRFHSSISQILKQTIYIGNDYNEQIREKDSLNDFIYDERELDGETRSR